MKKTIAILAAVFVLLMMCACSNNEPMETVAPTPETTAEQSAEVSSEPEVNDFVVVVDKPDEEPVQAEDIQPTEEPVEEVEEVAEVEEEPEPPHEHVGVDITVTYKDEPTDIGCMFYENGRIYISRSEIEEATGKTANGEEEYLPEINGHISMADISLQYDISMSCDAVNKVIKLYDSKPVEYRGTAGETKGYIRLEDVMADGAYNDGVYYYDATYSSYNLEKFRSMGEYLNSRGHKFYIAWIPVYADPTRGVVNNVIENECLYNADFIYSLDWLRIHGGSIVLHGYTHQQFDTISSVGNEFGGDTEYTIEQMDERMDKAIEMAKTLGYEHDIFEFPHYALIESSRALAEEKFDVIYQYGPAVSAQIETVERNGKTVRYVPTPPDYVYSAYDTTIWDRLEYAHNNGQLMSLFFHPTIDFNYCGMRTEAGVHYWTYDEENGFLPRILDTVEGFGDGYAFSHLD